MWELKSQIGKKRKKKAIQCYKKKGMKISSWDNIYSWFVKEATFLKNKITMAMLTMVFIFINKKFPSHQISIYSQQVWTQIEFFDQIFKITKISCEYFKLWIWKYEE